MTKRKDPIVPPCTITWSIPGEDCLTSKAGDIVIVQHRGGTILGRIMGRLIRFGEWLRPSLRKYSWTEHVMGVVVGGPNAVVVQETPKGAVYSSLVPTATEQGFTQCLYAVVSPTRATKAQRDAAVQFLEWTVGEGYGYWSLPVDAFDDVTGLHLAFSWSDRMVCSASGCRAAERWGLVPDRDPSSIQPADMARFFGASNQYAAQMLAQADLTNKEQ